MSIRARVMFLRDGQFKRVPARRFEALCSGNDAVAMPELAGQRVRCAIAYVDLVMRRAAGIAHVDYIVVPFGPDGRLDPDQRLHGDRLALEAASRFMFTVSEPAIPFGPYLAMKRYREEFRWTPTADQAAAVEELALAR